MNLKTCWYNTWNVFRRKLWFPALIFIVYLFALPISMAMQIQRYNGYWETADAAYRLQRISGIIDSSFGYDNMAVIALMIIIAFFAAACFFNYQHHRNQVDLFHSLPATRGGLFTAHFAAGFLAAIIPYLLNLLLAIAAVTAMGYGGLLSAPLILSGCGVHLLFFLAIFAVCVLAAALTGNSVVQGLLSIALLAIAPALLGCYQWVRATLQPAWYEELINWTGIVAYSSPVARYVMLAGNTNSLGGLQFFRPVDLLVASAFIIVIIALAFFAYKRRPSEAAGRALAFPWTRVVIKYPVVLCAMAGFAMTMHEIGDPRYSYVWYYVGAALGGFITAQIMEIIYRFDFHGIGKKLLPTAILAALFIGGSLLLVLDVGGYNSYVPEAEEITAAEVRLYNVSGDSNSDTMNYYYSVNDTVGGMSAITEDERLQRGYCDDPAAVAAVCGLARKMVANNGQTYDSDHNQVQAVVRYYLADGSVRVRDYTYTEIDVCQIKDELIAIYADEDFRAAQYALFAYDPACVRLSNVAAYNNYSYDYYDYYDYENRKTEANLNLEISGLLDIYRGELTALTGEDRLTTLPIGQLTFYVFAEDPGLLDYTSDDYLREQYLIFTYAVYPQFTGTLAALEVLGFGGWETDTSVITEIQLTYLEEDSEYREKYGYSGGVYVTNKVPAATVESVEPYRTETFTAAEDIARMISETYPDDAFYMNGMIEKDSSREVCVVFDSGYGYTDTRYRYYLR